MKKILVWILASIILLSTLTSVSNSRGGATAFESNENSIDEIRSIAELFMFEGKEEKRFDRAAGTEGEKEAAEYIKKLMRDFAPSFVRADDGVGKIDGVQSFTCINGYGDLVVSQNLIFSRVGEGDSKIVLSAAYDNMFARALSDDIIVHATGFNLSVLNIATLVHIASRIEAMDKLPFSVEIVFFGAENTLGEGSAFYKRGIDEVEAYKTLLFATIGDLAGNNQINIFAGEQAGKFSAFLTDTFNKSTQSSAFKKFSGGLSAGTSTLGSSNYSHIGMNFSASMFFGSDVPSANIFTGNFGGVVFYNYNDILNDTYQGSLDRYGKKTFVNAEIVSAALINFLYSEGRESTLREFWGSQGYDFWRDGRVSAAVTISVFVILLILQFFIGDGLKRRFGEALAREGKKLSDLSDITDRVMMEVEEGKLSSDRVNERIGELISENIGIDKPKKDESNGEDSSKKGDSVGKESERKDEKEKS